MCSNKKDNCNCVSEILSIILMLQQHSKPEDECLDTCDKGFLGNNVVCPKYNTRPIMLYTATGNGTPWEMPISKNDTSCESSPQMNSNVFRIEKLDGCCATFRVLKPSKHDPNTWKSTNSFFTMDLSCVCAIRCLTDTVVDL